MFAFVAAPGHSFSRHRNAAEITRATPLPEFKKPSGEFARLSRRTYVDTCALGIDVDTGAIPDFEAFYACLVEGFDEVLALAE